MQIKTKHEMVDPHQRFGLRAFYTLLDKEISVILPNDQETVGKLLDATVVDEGKAVELTIELDDVHMPLFTAPFN